MSKANHFHEIVDHPDQVQFENLLDVDTALENEAHHTEQATLLGRAQSKGRQLAAGVLATAVSVFGAAESTHAQTVDASNKKALEQRYNSYIQRFPDAIYVVPFADYYSPDNADYTCSRPQVILGNATYGYANKAKESVNVTFERKNSFYAGKVALIADPTQGSHTPSDQVWEKLAVSCSDLVNIDVKFEMRYLAESIKRGRKIREWKKIPKSGSAIAEQWQPSAVVDESTDDVQINRLSTRVDNLTVDITKLPKAKDVYPTIVIRSASKIEKYTTETAVILGKLQRTKTTINAGSKYHGRGGSQAVTSKTID